MPLVPSNDNAYEERHLTSDHYCELQDIPVLVIIEIGCYTNVVIMPIFITR